jgi:hypothetical protein
MSSTVWSKFATCIAGACAVFILASCDSGQPPDIRIVSIEKHSLQYPAHVIRQGDDYVATELLANRLAIAGSAAFSNPRYIEGQPLGTRFSSPHFIATTPNGVIFSEGWGSGVVLIPELAGDSYKRFKGVAEDRMHAPHGLCYSDDGWIYVADSLNSRLVRFRGMDGTGWQIFEDMENRIAYGRQLLCRKDGVWIVNSYENREGLNKGQGSNVLRIRDFDSGRSELVTVFPDTNATGMGLLDDRWLLVGLWGVRKRLVLVDLAGKFENRLIARPEGIAGPPYGISVDTNNRRIYVSHIGDIYNKTQQGGLVIYGY